MCCTSSSYPSNSCSFFAKKRKSASFHCHVKATSPQPSPQLQFNHLKEEFHLTHACRSQWLRPLGVGLRPLACWNCGFESHRVHGCLSLVSVVCCQVEVSASGLSLLQRSPTECGVSKRHRKVSTWRRSCRTRGS
jgi:hypothetical protein